MSRQLILGAFLPGALGLGCMLKPQPRKPLWRPDQPIRGWTSEGSTYRQYEEVWILEAPNMSDPFAAPKRPTVMDYHEYSDSSFTCHDFDVGEPTDELVAGEDLNVTWSLKVRLAYPAFPARQVWPSRPAWPSRLVVFPTDSPSVLCPSPARSRSITTWVPYPMHRCRTQATAASI